MKKKYYIKLFEIGLGLFILLIVIRNLGQLNQICVIDDEFGYWGVAAHFAGYDWTGLSPTSPYYGYGLSFIYAILFKIFSDSVIMYKAAIVLNGFFLVGGYFISLKCFAKTFPNIGEYYKVLFCFLIALYPNSLVQSQIAWTESLLYMWFWGCVLLLLYISDRPNIIKQIIFAIWLVYGLMIHQRTLGVVFAGAVLIILMKVLQKISWKEFLAFLIVFVLSIIIFWVIKDYLNDNFWLSLDPSIQKANNLSGQISKIQSIFSLDGLLELAYGAISKVLYLILSTFFIFLAYIMFSIRKGYKTIKKVLVERNNELKSNEWVVIFTLMSVVLTIMISAVFMYKINYRADVLLYGRYDEFIIGPVLMMGLGAIFECKEKIAKLPYFIVACLSFAFVTNYVLNTYEFTAFHATNAVGVATYFADLNYISNAIYSMCVKVILLVFLVSVVLSLKKYKKLQYIFSFIVIVVGFWYSAVNYNNENTYKLQEQFSANINDISTVINEINDEAEIYYVLDDSNAEALNQDLYDRNIKYVQFYNYKQRVSCRTMDDVLNKKNKKVFYIVRKDSGCFNAIDMQYKLKYENELYGLFVADNSELDKKINIELIH